MTPLPSAAAAGLKFGPLGPRAVHIAVDMQVLFAPGSDWGTAATAVITPMVAALADHAPQRTIFTRFICPPTADHANGQWRTFYRHWPSVLGDRNNPSLYDLVEPLRRFVPPARVVDKPTYSAYEVPAFQAAIAELAADTLIFSGVETDCCVLATAFTAMDRGMRVIVATDAVASGSVRSHAATLSHLYPRFDQQIELTDTATILKAWTP